MILPDIDKIKVEVDVRGSGLERVKLGEVYATNAGHDPDKRRNIPKRVNKKALLEQLRVESQSAARPLTIGDDEK